MKIIGLTGGIGSGKSTVAELLRRKGAVIIDADEIAHDLLAAGSPWSSCVATEFGREFLLPDGTPDRPRLAKLIFSDPAARQRLEAILHPPIFDRVNHRLERLRQVANPPPLVVVVAPLLFETEWEKNLEGVMVVTASETERIRRLQARDGLSEEEIRARFAAQLPPAKYLSRAKWVINNSGEPAATADIVDELWPALLESLG
jgi:dephospho-CoA kinase